MNTNKKRKIDHTFENKLEKKLKLEGYTFYPVKNNNDDDCVFYSPTENITTSILNYIKKLLNQN